MLCLNHSECHPIGIHKSQPKVLSGERILLILRDSSYNVKTISKGHDGDCKDQSENNHISNDVVDHRNQHCSLIEQPQVQRELKIHHQDSEGRKYSECLIVLARKLDND